MSPTPRQHYTTEEAEVPLPREARRELLLLVGIFLSARLMAIWWFTPLHNDVATFLFPFAWLQGQGIYPFLHYWSEYLPVQAYLMVALRWAAVAVCGRGSVAFEAACLTRTVQVASLVWELGVLHFVYVLARMLRGPKPALQACWVYVALFSTAFVSLSYVETFSVFLMLAGLFLAVYSQPFWSAVVLAGGAMAKLFPVGVLPAVLKCEARWRWRLVILAAFAAGLLALAAPFLIGGKPWLRLSLEVTARRPPWETVWALLDHRYEFAYLGPSPRDQRPEFFSEAAGFAVAPYAQDVLAAVPPEVFGPPAVRSAIFYNVAGHFATRLGFLDSQPRTGPAALWLYTGAGAALGLFYLAVFARLPSALPPRRRLYLAAFTMVLLCFYSKGWSPQFILYLIPLVLIAFRPGEGGLWALLLTGVTFLQMPVWAVYVHARPGMLLADQLLLHGTVIARTAFFLLIAARLYPRLFRD